MIQSLNISVACAVTIYEAFRQKWFSGQYASPQLPPSRQQELFMHWSQPDTNND
jgi:tRNA (guanosine-2'-O-)-methyltransferase